MGSSASLDVSPAANWIQKAGGLPPYVREVARSIHEKRALPLDRAIPIAIGVIRNWAEGKGGVTAKTKAKAAAALAQWEALKVKQKARKAAGAVSGKSGYSPLLETGSLAGDAMYIKDFPHIAGSDEERNDALLDALNEMFAGMDDGDDDDSGGMINTPGSGGGGGPSMANYVSILATFDDHVICQYNDFDGEDDDATWWVDYSWGGADIITLGTPRQITVSTQVDTSDPSLTADPYVEDMTGAFVGAAAKTLVQVKAGRVLSSMNADQLKQAYEHLGSVLRAAGVQVDGQPMFAPVAAPGDTTAPVATAGTVAQKAQDDTDLEAKGTLPPALAAYMASRGKKPKADSKPGDTGGSGGGKMPSVGDMVTLPDGVGGKGSQDGKVKSVNTDKGTCTVTVDGKDVTVPAGMVKMKKAKDDGGSGDSKPAFPGAAKPFGKKDALEAFGALLDLRGQSSADLLAGEPLDEKGVRHVRTAAGAAAYGKPIGSALGGGHGGGDHSDPLGALFDTNPSLAGRAAAVATGEKNSVNVSPTEADQVRMHVDPSHVQVFHYGGGRMSLVKGEPGSTHAPPFTGTPLVTSAEIRGQAQAAAPVGTAIRLGDGTVAHVTGHQMTPFGSTHDNPKGDKVDVGISLVRADGKVAGRTTWRTTVPELHTAVSRMKGEKDGEPDGLEITSVEPDETDEDAQGPVVDVDGIEVKKGPQDSAHKIDWNPGKHPRDKDGRYIKIGDTVTLPDGATGKVTKVGIDKVNGDEIARTRVNGKNGPSNFLAAHLSTAPGARAKDTAGHSIVPGDVVKVSGSDRTHEVIGVDGPRTVRVVHYEGARRKIEKHPAASITVTHPQPGGRPEPGKGAKDGRPERLETSSAEQGEGKVILPIEEVLEMQALGLFAAG